MSTISHDAGQNRGLRYPEFFKRFRNQQNDDFSRTKLYFDFIQIPTRKCKKWLILSGILAGLFPASLLHLAIYSNKIQFCYMHSSFILTEDNRVMPRKVKVFLEIY